MKLDWRETWFFGSAGLVGIGLPMLISMGVYALDEPVKSKPYPATSPCYVALKVCQSQLVKKIAPDYIYVLYSAINRVGNAVDSPDGCVRVTGNTGKGIYVFGTEQKILDDIEEAHVKCH